MTPEQMIKAGELLERVRKMEAENEALKAQLAALKSRINNGVRVYAERSFDEEWEAYGRWHKPANATLILILDEQGEE
jgi:uncharacterized protein YukE